MNKLYFRVVVISFCLAFSSCELFNIRDVASDNLDTLRLDQDFVDEDIDHDLKLSSIRKYLGKRPSEVKLWNTEPFKSSLQKILGNEYTGFVDLMQNAVPLKEEKLIYTIGSHPNLSSIGFGYLIIDPDKNLLRVGIVKPGNHRTFGAKTNEVPTPEEIERKCKTIL